MTFLRYFNILLIDLFLIALPIGAQTVSPAETDSLTLVSDTIAADSISPNPEWYVAPEIPVSLRAPKRAAAAAASCTRVEAIQTFNIDSVLTEGTYYEYDAKGNVISTTVWTYNPDGTMTGKSKNEYAFDATGTQTMTAVYIWDGTANDWKGTEKYEYVYKTFAGEKKMTSSTSSVWLNGAWVADQRFTYDYDASLREISYFEYRRNTSTNELQPVKGREQSWTDDLQTLEALYTAYANGKWTAGTKKEWAFDGNGTQTMYATYTISNGAWVGSSKETWAYGGPTGQLTLHEQFGWAGSDWSKTLKEETEYSGANIVRIENYTYANGVPTGTNKETWTYGGPSGQLTLHEQFGWANNDWAMTLKEENEYSGANIVRVENYTYANGEPTGTKKELTTYTNGKKTEFITYAWSNGDWVNSNKETWEFNGPSGKQTKHEKCEWSGSDWTVMVQENTTYNGNTTTIENYERIAGTWTGTKKEENTVVSGKPSQTIIYAWDATAENWVESTKETWGYTSGKKTAYEKYNWENGAWIKSEKEVWAYSGSTQTLYEKYIGQNDEWIGVEKEVWAFTSGKQTLHETYEWYNDGWSVTLRELSGYDAAGNKNSIENYTGSEGVLTAVLKEEYTFNSAKEVIVTVKYKWSEGVWVEDTKNEVGYREGNTEYSEANYTWNGSAWVGTGNKTVTEYYAEDKVSAAWAYAWSTIANNWVYAARRICEYDGKGRSIGDTTYTYSNGAWEYYKLQTHGFDSHDNDTLAVTATWNGAEWNATFIAKGTYTYTPSGDPLLVETYTGLEGSWVGQKKRVWKYNDFGSQTLYHVYEWKNTGWVNKEKREQTYDANNHLLVDQSYSWNSKKWEGVDKDEYAYDENGHQCMSAHYLWLNGGWYGISKSEQIMDENGIVLTSFSSSWKTNKWVYTFQYNYIYDEGGRIAEKITQQYKNNNWINYKRETHGYYVSGNKVEEIATYAYQWKSSTWRLVSLLHKHYDDPEHKLRSEEIGSWDSSTGDLVSYSDNHYFYNCDPHFYTVRFVNYDGKVLANMTAQEGETPTYVGSNPTREGNAEYSYTFSGWNPTLGPVTSNVTYTATFTATKNTYTITWKNEDGTQIDQTTAEYGTMPTHEDASKANTAEYTYTFAGWTPGIGIVTGDAEYTATFTQTKRSYVITFKNEDGSLISTAEVEYGTMPTIPTAPTKPADGANTYTFAGWDNEIVEVNGAATYTATYTATKKTYTIAWKNEDGTLIDKTTAEYGTMPTHDDASKANTAEYTYTFAGWTPGIGIVTGDATYTATFTATKNKYLITFKDEDGTILKSEELEYGVMPTAPSDPTKAATAEWTYTFAGWDKEIISVAEATTYTATYTATKNSYTITWLNVDDSEIEHETLEYGATPSHEAPFKANTAEWTYTFEGWDPEIIAVNGDASYKAVFTATKNKYLIVFQDEGGAELQSGEVEYGTTPEYSGAQPSKEATAQYAYYFSGWEPEITAVEGAQTYTAKYSSTVNKYTITWLNEDGDEIEHETLEYGVTPEHAAPTKENTAEWTYTFIGWDPAMESVKGDASYKATFSATKNSYSIQFLNYNGEVLQSANVEYGVKPEYKGSVPVKPEDDEFHYAFAGWNKEIVEVAGEETYTATFSTTTNEYTISWFNDDNTLIDQTTVAYGVVPTHDDPSKENTAEFTYTFAGWDHDPVAVTGNASYTATYNATKNKYLIVFQDEGGAELQNGEVEYGTTPVFTGTEPSKEATAQYAYYFSGWEPEITAVEGAQTYTAKYSSTVNKYTIRFINDDDSELQSSEVEYGTMPTYDGETPHKDADEQYTYTFAGWDQEIVSVTGEATYKATYSSTTNQYTIKFVNYDGDELQSSSWNYGAMPSYSGETPTKPADDEFHYAFDGWDKEIVEVGGPETYTATFSTTTNEYTITWFNDDNTLIDQTTVAYGVVPTHDDPSKENTAEFTYTFAGWDHEPVAVIGNASYTATYNATKNKYLVVFQDEGGTELQSGEVEYGETPAFTGAEPSKEATAQYTYYFSGWDPEITAVEGAQTYTAKYSSTVNSYTITWLNDDDSQIDQTTVAYGETPTHADAEKPNTAEWTYTFTGWDPEIIAVDGDATYKATYSATKNSYTVTWLNNDGSQIDQTTVEYGLTPAHANINKENTAEWTYTFVGWMPEIKEVTGDATYTATFDSVKNSYAITFYDEDGTTVLDSRDWEYGAIPTCAEPTKPATEQYTYSFAGWTPEIVAVTGEAAYTATYATEEIKYHVSVSTDDATHGKAGFVYADSGSSTLLTEGDILNGTWIELQATADNEWHFDHWSDGDTSAVRQVEVTSDMQFTAYFAINCGDYPSLPVVCLYDWLLMLDVRSIHDMGYSFGEEDVTWYRVHGEPDKLSDGASADDELLGTGYSFTLNQSLVNTGDYYAMVDVSKSSSDMLCTDMMRSKIVHYASSGAAAPPMLEPALVRPNAPQRVHHLNPEASTTISIYDIAGHLLRTFTEEGVEQINLQAEGVAGCYQIVVQNGDLRTVLRYIVVN